MAMDYEKVMALRIPENEHTYTARDTMLYGLGVGMGTDPMDRRELAFVFEKELRVVPTMVTVIGGSVDWLPQTGIDRAKEVHGEQRISLHRPLPSAATVISRVRILDVFDKGPGKGAIILSETTIHDKKTGELLCTNHSTSFARGDGGFGGPAGSGPAPHPIPDRKPDAVCDLSTHPNQALVYRLSGDWNPLHADPAYAAAAGFPQPILHGLCTYGFACRAVLRTLCDYDPARITGFAARFTSPVFPGDTLHTEMWQDGAAVAFRTRALERDVVVLNHGKATLSM
jgi:acyl dehydratase